jgi:hypothetical protein
LLPHFANHFNIPVVDNSGDLQFRAAGLIVQISV